MVKWMRNDLKRFAPYRAAQQPCRVKLDANESPYGLPDGVKQAMIQWLSEDNLRLYPDSDSTELRSELAAFWGISPENIICGVGSDQIIDFITKVFLEPGDAVAATSPTFSMYTLAAQLNHGTVLTFPLNADFSLNTDGFIQFAKNGNVKIAFLCTPNNPTGNSIPREDIQKIASALDCVVVVDEAYADFSGSAFIHDALAAHPNVIVLRTFSKAYGAAGARVGYGVAEPGLIEALNVVKPPFNLNAFSQRLAVEILRGIAGYRRHIKDIAENTRDLFERLSSLPGITAHSSDGNFIYVESELPIAARLLEEGALVRGFNSGSPEILRISAGTVEQNALVCRIIIGIYGSGGKAWPVRLK